MTGKRSNGFNSALVSVGVVALVAGCAGGGATQSASGGTTYVPPGGTQMTTATLHLTVPGRRPGSANRSPRYVSAGTSRIDVGAVSAGTKSPWPIATSTSVPTPGPVASGASPTPIPITMTVQAPLGSDQFLVNAYDPAGYLLSGVSSAPTSVVPNSSNNIPLVLNAAAECVEINGATGNSVTFTPLENQSADQTMTFTVTPCDIDGYPIPAGQQLANAIVFATPAPATVTVNGNTRKPMVAAATPTPAPTPTATGAPAAVPATLSFSPSSITQGGPTTVTVTFPKGASAPAMAQAVPSPLPTANYGGFPAISADPLYYVLVSDSLYPSTTAAVDVIVHDAQNLKPPASIGSITVPGGGTGAGPIAGGSPSAGCASAGQALTGSANASGYLGALTIPAPIQGQPTPMPAIAPIQFSGGQAAKAIALDKTCKAYVGDSQGYLFSFGLAGTPSQIGGPFYSTGMSPGNLLPISGIAFDASATAYVGLGPVSGMYGRLYTSNIQTAPGSETAVANSTVAMRNMPNGDVALAYQPGGSGNYHLATWTPPNGMLNNDQVMSNSASYGAPVGVAADPSGNVWALQSWYLWELSATAPATLYSLPSGCSGTGIAIAPDGMIFVACSGSNKQLMMFSSRAPADGVTGALTPRATVSLQNGPAGVTVVP